MWKWLPLNLTHGTVISDVVYWLNKKETFHRKVRFEPATVSHGSGGCKPWKLPGPFFLHVVPLYSSHTFLSPGHHNAHVENIQMRRGADGFRGWETEMCKQERRAFFFETCFQFTVASGDRLHVVMTQPGRSLLHRGAFVLRAMITSADWIKAYGSLDTSELNQQHVWLIINERHIGGAQVTSLLPTYSASDIL